ncbi:uncharacterized protein HHUB_5101 (plasmid) [Halobacterium hubeiense]|uniref:Uncharacterized protein n=1 Tax=Halobacterium hubeiense TaxID=1407499 RepID=A0A0U5H6K4_9EURY|nr:hypothetical protein [Halobacterium hubeiense]CQH64615.1 uncharacterized protein HHUB_5101 [Halobacterium hubeiense]
MIDTLSLPSTVQAAGLIGAVLLEAMALHVGYGVVTKALGPNVKRALGGE